MTRMLAINQYGSQAMQSQLLLVFIRQNRKERMSSTLMFSCLDFHRFPLPLTHPPMMPMVCRERRGLGRKRACRDTSQSGTTGTLAPHCHLPHVRPLAVRVRRLRQRQRHSRRPVGLPSRSPGVVAAQHNGCVGGIWEVARHLLLCSVR